MNHIEIPDIGYAADMPSSFDEMSRSQILYVAKLTYDLQCGAITYAEFRVRVLYHFMGIKRTASSIAWEQLHPDAARQKFENTVLLADQLLGFLFAETNGQIAPAYNCITNHIPVLRTGLIQLYGPGDGLLDMSFAELRAADAELKLYAQTGDSRHADNLVACLYRPKGPMQPAGRKVTVFSSESIDKYSKLMRFVPAWKKQLIIRWYVACVDYLQNGYFTIDGREICFAPLFAGEGGSPESLGWLSVHFDLAEKRTFGDMDQTGAANIIDILSRLYDYKITSDYVRKNKTTD